MTIDTQGTPSIVLRKAVMTGSPLMGPGAKPQGPERSEGTEMAAAESANAKSKGGHGMETTVITAKELPKNLSFQFNPRAPSPSSRAYKLMRATLETAPESFVELNTGIVIANGKFVLDGGHTILAIQDAIREAKVDATKVRLRVTWMKDLSEEQMVQRSVSLNTKVTPPLRGEKAIQGFWNVLEKNLNDEFQPFFEFKPNTKPGAKFHVDFLVALLHGWQEHSPERSYASKGVLVRLFTADKYQRLLPFLNLSVEWWSFIYQEMLKDKRVMKWEGVNEERTAILPNGKDVKGFIPEAYVWPVYAAFHTIIAKQQGALVKDVRKAIEEAWDAKKVKMLNKLAADYKEQGFNPTRLGKTSEVYLHQVVALLS